MQNRFFSWIPVFSTPHQIGSGTHETNINFKIFVLKLFLLNGFQ